MENFKFHLNPNDPNSKDIDCDTAVIPDAFNSHFLAVGGSSEAAARVPPSAAHRQYLTTAPNASLCLAPTTIQQEIETTLNNLKCTAAGIDDIPPNC